MKKHRKQLKSNLENIPRATSMLRMKIFDVFENTEDLGSMFLGARNGYS